MNLSIRRLRSPDLPACAELVLRGNSLSDKGAKAGLLNMWGGLLRAGSAVAAVVEDERHDGRRIVGLGMCVFVRGAFVQRAQQRRLPPYVLSDLIATWTRCGELPVLRAKEIERANRAGGLNFLGLHTEFGENVLPAEECMLVRDELFHSLGEFLRGYNLKYWMKEVYGPEERDRFVGRFGCRVLSDYEAQFSAWLGPRPSESVRPYLLGLSDADALHPDHEHYAVRGMFLKRWPRYGFSEGERTLLHAAIEGVSRQEDQAEALCISLAAIKKRWESIYKKVAARDAASPPGMDLPENEQPVNHVLNYVRRNIEEIRPPFFPWP